ncbi:MAG: nucleotidyltransferase family protein [bacterium]|nr:nucleotidyltransferase family protein [bacterium]MDZ4248100.1 nucleotidyltransferase family protein [Patescibacteria group bacterium]
MMDVLRSASELDLPDWMIGAGFVRNKVWDHLHGYTDAHRGADIDLIYFDPDSTDEQVEKRYERKLSEKMDEDWSVTNQVRMHEEHGDAPYRDSEDALAYWPETATCVAVRIGKQGKLELIAPHGIDDLVNLVVRPGPLHTKPEEARARIAEKRWLERWPKLKVIGI